MKYTFKTYVKSEILRNHLNLGGVNPSGDKIEVTSLYLERNNRPWLPTMGEFHFNRADRNDWYRELCKMKAGGINVVATYLFWIYHEEEEGVVDFSGDLDIRQFVLDAEKAGMEVVLRVGPWAHGEARNGGLPDWLLKKSFKVRENDPEYLEYVKKWYKAIAEQVEGLFYKDGGNIVAVQLENELTNRPEHLARLKEIALETGLIAPLYTVTGWNSKYGAKIPVDEVLPVFGGYPDAPWAGGIHDLPLSMNFAFYTMRNDSAIGADLIKEEQDQWQLPYERYPYATCEMGPGMQSTHHRRVVVSGEDAYALSMVKLGAGNNLVGYYMYHGGTNKIGRLSTFNETKATGYPNDYPILNYDFGTCLSQYGEARPQYRMLNLLHLFINDFGSSLAEMEHVDPAVFADENNLTDLRYCLRTDGKSGYIFVSNHQRHAKLPAFRGVSFDTGSVVFPEIDIKEDLSFILPYNLEASGQVIKYATAQLLCRDGNTLFFTEIPGIQPEYCFEDGEIIKPVPGIYAGAVKGDLRIVTLEYEQALYLRKLGGKVYVGKAADIYEYFDYIDEKNVIGCIQAGDFTYYEWSGVDFYEKTVEIDARPAAWTLEKCEPAFEIDPMLGWELNIESKEPRQITWMKLCVQESEGFIEIDEQYDVAMIFADGTLAADRYYDGAVWRLPSWLLANKECYLVMSELKADIYVDKKID